MLLEDAARGSQVECLVCKKPIQVDASGSSETPKAQASVSTAHDAQPSERVKRQEIVNCPKCKMPLRLAANHENRKLKCPHCAEVFVP